MKSKTQPFLLTLSLILFSATLIFWLSQGAHTGWSQTQVKVMQYDEITEIEFPVWEDKFVPGVEILGIGVFLSVAVASLSLILHTRKRMRENNSSHNITPVLNG